MYINIKTYVSVYPSFDLSDEEEDSIYKSKKKAEKDDNWNPKGRNSNIKPNLISAQKS